MKLSKKLLGVTVASAFAVSCLSTSAHATLLSDFLSDNGLYGERNYSDQSAEFQDVDLNGNGILNEGDTLRGVVTIDQISSLPTGAADLQLSGIFEVEVDGKTDIGTVDPDSISGSGDEFNGYNFTFKPNAGFASEWESNLGLATGDLAQSSMLLFEQETSLNPAVGTYCNRSSGSISAVEGDCTDGTFLGALGFGEDDDELWQSNGVPDSVGATAAAATALGNPVNIQQSVLVNNFGVGFEQVEAGFSLDDGLIDVNGGGSFVSPTAGSYPLWNNVDFTLHTVPEPAALGLFGIGLLGLGGMAARRRKSA